MKTLILSGKIRLCAALAIASQAICSAQEWTRFRGPNGAGISHAKTVPTKISDADIQWKIDLPGTGHSSPVLWGERIFLTCTGDKSGGISVLCLGASDGRLLWRRDFSLNPFPRHQFNSYASSTPAVDAARVYVLWNEPDHYILSALDHDGKSVWQRDFGPFVSQHGCGISPLVYQDTVILGNEQDDAKFVKESPRSGQSFVVAVEAKTGKTVWQTPRRSAVVAYSTPCIYEPAKGKPAVVFTSQGQGVYALDLENGHLLWDYEQAFDKRCVSSPLIKKSAPYVPTGIVIGDHLWLWSDGGIVSCVEAATGAIRYQERVGGNYFGSPIWIDGRLFCVSTSGELVVVEASDQFKVLHRYSLHELCHSTPAVALGRLFIRTEKHLWSLGTPKNSPMP